MKYIIAGGRDFKDEAQLDYECNTLINYPEDVIICGEANGADTLGKFWALERGCAVLSFPADWQRHGKSAGYRRNLEMAKVADALIAFWNGKSKGTKHMIDIALEHGLEVHVYRYE